MAVPIISAAIEDIDFTGNVFTFLLDDGIGIEMQAQDWDQLKENIEQYSVFSNREHLLFYALNWYLSQYPLFADAQANKNVLVGKTLTFDASQATFSDILKVTVT